MTAQEYSMPQNCLNYTREGIRKCDRNRKASEERNPAAEQRICGRSRAQYAKSGKQTPETA